jgi:hypothetical protein
LHFGLMLGIILLLLSFRFRHWLLSTLRLFQFCGSKRSKALCTWAKPSRSRWVTSWLRPQGSQPVQVKPLTIQYPIVHHEKYHKHYFDVYFDGPTFHKRLCG